MSACGGRSGGSLTTARLHKVETHRFDRDGQLLSLDVRRSRLFVLGPCEREVLDAPEGTPLDELAGRLGTRHPASEVGSALERLRKRDLVLPQPAPPEEPGAPGFQGICHVQLSAAHDCNLRCRYCLVDEGSFGGPAIGMSAGTARQAVDLLMRESEGAPFRRLVFSGGEPLLNWPVVRDCILYCEEQAARHGGPVHYLVKTNGVLLGDEEVEFLAGHRVVVQVSVDGPPAVHDALRPNLAGRGSHAGAAAGLRRLVARCAGLAVVRATLTRFSPPLPELLDYLAGFGAGSVEVIPVLAVDGDFALDAAAVERLKDGFSEVAGRAMGEGAGADAAMRLFGRYLVAYRAAQSGDTSDPGGAVLAVAASGDLYPSPELAGWRNYRLGQVGAGIDKDRLAAWRRYRDVRNRPVCSGCWARHVCGGGCASAAIKLHGEPNRPLEPDCDLTRHVVELALRLHFQQRQRRIREVLDVVGGLAEGQWGEAGDAPILGRQ